MSQIPWYGWLALALIVVFLIAINVYLFSSLRGKKKASKVQSTHALHRLGEAIRHPWKVEDDMISELARRTAELRDASESRQDSDDKLKK